MTQAALEPGSWALRLLLFSWRCKAGDSLGDQGVAGYTDELATVFVAKRPQAVDWPALKHRRSCAIPLWSVRMREGSPALRVRAHASGWGGRRRMPPTNSTVSATNATVSATHLSRPALCGSSRHVDPTGTSQVPSWRPNPCRKSAASDDIDRFSSKSRQRDRQDTESTRQCPRLSISFRVANLVLAPSGVRAAAVMLWVKVGQPLDSHWS